MSKISGLRPTLMMRPVCLSRMLSAAVVLGMLLPLYGFAADTDTPPTGDSPTAESLLSGAKAGRTRFDATTGFRLTQNTIQLETHLGGASPAYSFILDSGAPMTIAPQLVRQLGIEPAADVELVGPEGGHLEVPVVQLPEVTIAGLPFRDVGAVVSWVEPPDEVACLSSAGLLGASLLQAAIWQIDFETQQITVTDSLSRTRGLEHATRIPFERADASGSPRIVVGVSNDDKVSMLVDLGFNGSIAIPTAWLEKAGDRIADEVPTEVGQASSTVFGHKASQVYITRLRELRLGDLRLPDFPVITGTAVSDFHVGIEFLRHFRVTLDWLHNDLYLELREPQSALYEDFAVYGFSPQLEEGHLVVTALWQGGASQQPGLQLGDRLVEVDGRDTATPDFETLCSLLDSIGMFGSNDAPISVTRLRDGKRETVRMQRVPLLQASGSH